MGKTEIWAVTAALGTNFGKQLLSMRESKMAAANKDNPFYAGAGTKTAQDIMEIIDLAARLLYKGGN